MEFKGNNAKISPNTMRQMLASYHKIPDDSYSPGEAMKLTHSHLANNFCQHRKQPWQLEDYFWIF